MHPVGSLVDKDRNRGIGAGIWNELGHLLHDEGIPNDEANHLRRLITYFFANNRAVIQLHKQHQSYVAQAFLNCAFQFGRRARFVSRSPKFSHIRMTDSGVHTDYYFVEWLGSRQTEPLYLEFSYHLESLCAQPP